MKSSLTLFILFTLIALLTILLGFPQAAFAQLPPPPPQQPIDGGLALLAAAGGGYAIKKLRDRKE